jgi:hypothetical protein
VEKILLGNSSGSGQPDHEADLSPGGPVAESGGQAADIGGHAVASSQPSLSPRSSLSSVSPPVSPYEPAAARPALSAYESPIRPPSYELLAAGRPGGGQQMSAETAIRPPTYEQAFHSSQERQRKLQVERRFDSDADPTFHFTNKKDKAAKASEKHKNLESVRNMNECLNNHEQLRFFIYKSEFFSFF